MLTVIIPWCDRSSISEALQRNRDVLAEFEIIVVNVAGDRGQLVRHVARAGLNNVRLVHVAAAAFNKSLALNIGIHLASHDACLVLDADIVLDDYKVTDALQVLEEECFVTLGRVAHVREEGGQAAPGLRYLRNLIELELADGRITQVETSSLSNVDKSRSGPGILLARKSWLVGVSGYNSRLQGWGWEDIDMIVRLQFSGLQRRQYGFGLHLTDEHPPSSLETKRESEARNRLLAYNNYAAGNLRGTLEQDVRRCFPKTGS